MKKKVLLVCGAGVSTSIVARLLQNFDFTENFVFSCCDINSAPIKVLENDLVVLAPHVKFMQQKLEKICNRYGTPIFVMETSDYMNGDTEKLLNRCKETFNLIESAQMKKIVFLYDKVGYLSQTLIKNESFQVIARNRAWIIEAHSIDDYMHTKDVCCILIEPQSSYHKPSYFKNRNFDNECAFMICPASAYQDATGIMMEKFILDVLKQRRV